MFICVHIFVQNFISMEKIQKHVCQATNKACVRWGVVNGREGGDLGGRKGAERNHVIIFLYT